MSIMSIFAGGKPPNCKALGSVWKFRIAQFQVAMSKDWSSPSLNPYDHDAFECEITGAL